MWAFAGEGWGALPAPPSSPLLLLPVTPSSAVCTAFLALCSQAHHSRLGLSGVGWVLSQAPRPGKHPSLCPPTWSLVSKPHSTPYLCRGCAGGHRGTWEGSLHLIHLGVSTPAQKGPQERSWAKGNRFPPHISLEFGDVPPLSFTVAFKRGFSWGRGSPGLWGLRMLTPTRLAQACPSPGCWLSPGPASGSLCRHLDLTSGWTCGDEQQPSGKSQGLGFGPASSPLPVRQRVCGGRLTLRAISSSSPCPVLPPEAHLCLIHQPAFLPWGSSSKHLSPEDSSSRDLGSRERLHQAEDCIAGVCSRGREEMAPAR